MMVEKPKAIGLLDDGTLYDRETGVVLEDTGIVLRSPKRPVYKFGEWVAMAQSGYLYVSKECSSHANRVFNYMMANMVYENYWVNVNKSEVARELDINRVTVRKAISELFSKGVLLDLEDGHITLNPEVGYKGKAKGQIRLQKRIDSHRDLEARKIGDGSIGDNVLRFTKNK